jgi:hypothetical protein
MIVVLQPGKKKIDDAFGVKIHNLNINTSVSNCFFANFKLKSSLTYWKKNVRRVSNNIDHTIFLTSFNYGGLKFVVG